jgi:hypothetical protein
LFGTNQPPIGLQMLLAYIDGRQWPLHNCGDLGIGLNALPWGAVDENLNRYTAIDAGPVPGNFPLDPPVYPNIGITAHACQIDCNYLISGPLGAEAIVGKIDDQWHILRVTGTAQPSGMFGPSNECRCCGNSLGSARLRAEIIGINTPGCSEYPLHTVWEIDTAFNTGNNPLSISFSCQPTPESLLEDKDDWSAFACGVEAEVRRLNCCAPYEETGTGTGTGTACRFEAVIRTAVVEGCSECSYDILITVLPEDPCVEFEDEPFGEPVIMEACGLPNLEPGTRVIMAYFPHDNTGTGTGTANETIDWFVIRACTSDECANPCDVDPPVGPPCCGLLCSEMPETVTVAIEVLAGDISCPDGAGVTLIRTLTANCDGAADTRWTLAAPVPENTLCPGTTPDPPNYPTWLDIESMQIVCGSDAELCGNVDLEIDGPSFSLAMSGGLVTGDMFATQNLRASCCSPLYLEFEITGQFAMVGGAGVINHEVTLRLTVTA